MDKTDPATRPWFDGPPVLNRRFVIYLPSKKKTGQPVDNLEALASGIANMLSGRFGGATSYPATGHFGNQRESITVIECFCGEDAWRESSEDLFALAKALARYCEQEAIACSLDGDMILVGPSHDGDSAAAESLIGHLMEGAPHADAGDIRPL